jgi:hypothetical protein
MAHSDYGEYREEFHGEHPHSYDHTEPKYSLLWIIGGVILALLIFVGIGIQLYYEQSEETTVYNRVLSRDSWQLQYLRRTEAQELSSYGYVDPQNHAAGVRIPIDQAMRMVIQDAAANHPKYPTAPYAVRTETQLAANPSGVSPAGAAAAAGAQTSGVPSSPNVQQSNVPQQPHK